MSMKTCVIKKFRKNKNKNALLDENLWIISIFLDEKPPLNFVYSINARTNYSVFCPELLLFDTVSSPLYHKSCLNVSEIVVGNDCVKSRFEYELR